MVREYHMVVTVHDPSEESEALVLVIGEDLLRVLVVDGLEERREDVEARWQGCARDIQREVLEAIVDAWSDYL